MSRTAAYLVAALAVGFVGLVGFRTWGTDGGWLVLVIAVFLTTPAWTWASMLAAVVTVDEDGVRHRGLVRTGEVPWSAVRRARARSGLYGYRQLTLEAARRKLSVSTNMPGFEPVARAILREAEARGLEVKTERGASIERWLEGARIR